MTPGQKRGFTALASLTLATAALGGTVSAQEPANIDNLMFGSDYAPTEGTPGGSVVIADWQVATNLNYYLQNAFKNTQVIQAAFDQLWDVSSDFKYIPEQAVSIPKLSDGSIRIDAEPTAECPNRPAGTEDVPGFEVDLNIRPDLKWSDGETLDLNDLKYTMDWILSGPTGLAAGKTGWDVIDKFEVAEDGLSALLHFCTGYAGLYGLLGSPMLPEHYMSTIPVADASTLSYPVAPSTVDAPVSGPFKFASLSPSAIEMVRNDNWKSPFGGHAPYLDRVVYRFFDDSKDAMIAAFLAGEIDVATDLLQGDYAAISSPPEGFEARILPAWETEHFDFNQSGGGPGKGHPALTDPNVRTALATAIDKVGLYAAVYPGIPAPEEVACSITPPGLYFATTEGLTCIQYDQAKAIELLDASGWIDSDGDGIRDKDGVKLSLLHCHTGAPFRLAAGDFIASAYRDIGVELLNTASGDVFLGWDEVAPDAQCNLAHGNYDTAEFAWVNTFDAFGNFFYSYESSQIPTDENGGAGSNYIRFNNPEMDALLQELYSATDPAVAADIVARLQGLHSELQPEVVLYYRSNVRGVNPKMGNYLQNPGTGSDMWNVGDWHLPAE